MFYVSEKWIMIPVYLLLIYFLQKNYGWKTTGIIIFCAAVLVAACDLTVTHLFKNTFMRYRPSHNLELQGKLHFVDEYKGGMYGFISGHAANMMALAVFIGYFLYGKVKHYATFSFAIVFLVCYSRIYLGVHYPSDVVAGLFVGTFFAILFIYVYGYFFLPVKRDKL
jgi:undecaprenyl-diphosphatase